MANKNRKNRIQPDQVPNLEIPIDVLVEQLDKQISNPIINEIENVNSWAPVEHGPRYVVTRDDLRVSDRDYSKTNDPSAIAESEFWQKIVDKWQDGTKIKIVQYDKKKHRIW